MSWHHPDLYFLFCVLAVLTGLASFLAIIYECRRKPPVALEKAKPLDGLQVTVPRGQPKKGQASGRAISVGSPRASRTSRRRTKQAACVNISESSEERAPAGSHPARFNDSNSAHVRACRVEPNLLAATNKCLARSNKSHTGVPATNKRPAARRNSSARRQFGETRCGVNAAGLSPPFGGASRAEAEHELSLFHCLRVWGYCIDRCYLVDPSFDQPLAVA